MSVPRSLHIARQFEGLLVWLIQGNGHGRSVFMKPDETSVGSVRPIQPFNVVHVLDNMEARS